MRTTLLASLLMCLLGCDQAPGSARSASPPKPAATRQPDALDKMAAVFVDSSSRSEIKAAMDRAFDLFGVPQTEDNYLKYGSILVRLRKDFDTPEMAVLRFAIRLREESPSLAMDL